MDGAERLLQVDFDKASLTVNFQFDQDKDPVHDEESEGVEQVSVSGSMVCSSNDQFDGFVRAFIKGMRRTSYSLQDPNQIPFNRMDADRLDLSEFTEGVSLEELTCKIPAELVPYILPSAGAAPELIALSQ